MMRYGPATLRHYLQVFARRFDLDTADVNSEIEELCRDFEGTFDSHLQRIEQLERTVSNLAQTVATLAPADD